MPKLIKHASSNFSETKYGFEWGAADVERVLSNDRGVVLLVKTQRQRLEVFVTPTGLIRTSLTDNPKDKHK